MEFVSIFQEGKELAEQSEILEQPHAGSLNPDDIYYGQGMWPDRVGQTNNDENAAAQWLRHGITACDPNLAIALANFISSEKIELQPLDEWIKKIVNCLKEVRNFQIVLFHILTASKKWTGKLAFGFKSPLKSWNLDDNKNLFLLSFEEEMTKL